MPKLFWLVYRNDDDVGVNIQPARSLIYARMRAALAGMYGEFQGGHELDDKTAKKVPKNQIGKPLTRRQANALLKKLDK